ncbi:MAG: NYN domain-containing protein [Pseudomonadales bacterium]|nr:NYN domain-containing protein [Pseudomonadales bacterium]
MNKVEQLPTTAVFIDVQNVYYTVREGFGRNFDYNKFWAKICSNHQINAAFAYAIDRGDEKQKQFQNILRAIGFEVKLKPYITRKDGSAKGDWDVGITLDVIDYASRCDEIILVTGDGDFDLLINKVRSYFKKNVTVYGVERLTARSLIQAASDFIAIDEGLLL